MHTYIRELKNDMFKCIEITKKKKKNTTNCYKSIIVPNRLSYISKKKKEKQYCNGLLSLECIEVIVRKKILQKIF